MSILVVDTGMYQPDSLLHLLKTEFSMPVRLATDLRSTLLALETHAGSIDLVLFNTDDFLHTLRPALLSIRRSKKAPATVLLASRPHYARMVRAAQRVRTERSGSEVVVEGQKIDLCLSKPLHFSKLVSQIVLAHERWLKGRPVLLLKDGVDKAKVDESRGVFIDARCLSRAQALNFKRILNGYRFPVAIYGLYNEGAFSLRSIASDYYPDDQPLEQARSDFEAHSAHFLLRKILIGRLKNLRATGDHQRILKCARDLQRIYPCSAFSHGASAGVLYSKNKIKSARDHWTCGIRLNPFYPENYLKMWDFVRDNPTLHQMAKTFCGNHPKIKELLNTHAADC